MAVLVGLTGRKTAGKDTAAERLINEYGFQKIAFADPIREMARKLNPIIVVGLDDFERATSLRLMDFINAGWSEEQVKHKYPVYREFLKILGTDCVRTYDEDFWVNAALKRVLDPNGRYVFTDARFPNEASGLRARAYDGDDVHLWQVQNDRAEAVPVDHPSEQWAGHLDEDLKLDNNRSIEELYIDIDELAVTHGWVSVPALAA